MRPFQAPRRAGQPGASPDASWTQGHTPAETRSMPYISTHAHACIYVRMWVYDYLCGDRMKEGTNTTMSRPSSTPCTHLLLFALIHTQEGRTQEGRTQEGRVFPPRTQRPGHTRSPQSSACAHQPGKGPLPALSPGHMPHTALSLAGHALPEPKHKHSNGFFLINMRETAVRPLCTAFGVCLRLSSSGFRLKPRAALAIKPLKRTLWKSLRIAGFGTSTACLFVF